MIAMIFEFWLNDDEVDNYTPYSGKMRQLVDEIEGFISVERYRSEYDPDKILALGFFRDETAVEKWRNHPAHRQAQQLGRQKYYTNYRLRMAEVVRDYDRHNREQVPHDSQSIHDTN
mgnify:CR=1 FL=1